MMDKAENKCFSETFLANDERPSWKVKCGMNFTWPRVIQWWNLNKSNVQKIRRLPINEDRIQNIYFCSCYHNSNSNSF